MAPLPPSPLSPVLPHLELDPLRGAAAETRPCGGGPVCQGHIALEGRQCLGPLLRLILCGLKGVLLPLGGFPLKQLATTLLLQVRVPKWGALEMSEFQGGLKARRGFKARKKLLEYYLFFKAVGPSC